MTSNIHNLTHLIDDVQKFGVLQSFTAYPFENKLGQMKKLIRNGRTPLTQLAKRISEMTQLDTSKVKSKADPILSHPSDGNPVSIKFKTQTSKFFFSNRLW